MLVGQVDKLWNFYRKEYESNRRILLEEDDERRWGGNCCCELPTRVGNVWQRSESASVPGLV